MSDRHVFVERLVEVLEQGPYAVLKHHLSSLAHLPQHSDVDLLVPQNRLAELERFTGSDPLVERFKCLRKASVTFVWVFFKDGGFLQLDLIHSFTRKTLTFMDASQVLANSTYFPPKKERVPCRRHEFEYIFLFSLLNGANIPARYQRYFRELPRADQLEIVEAMNETYGLSVVDLGELFPFSARRQKLVVEGLKRLPQNRRTRQGLVGVRYLLDLAHRARRGKRGIAITFSGPDGSGKSTVLKAVQECLSQRYRQDVVVLRHRPGLLPILSSLRFGRAEAERLTMTRLPRTGTNDSKSSSVLRFSYYLCDYLAGQWVVRIRHSWRGRVVLYDRYYFDFIVDGRRSNIQLPSAVTKYFYRFVLSPELNVLLYVNPQVAYERKQELPESVISELTNDYRSLFRELSDREAHSEFVCVENLHLNSAVDQIVGRVRSLL